MHPGVGTPNDGRVLAGRASHLQPGSAGTDHPGILQRKHEIFKVQSDGARVLRIGWWNSVRGVAGTAHRAWVTIVGQVCPVLKRKCPIKTLRDPEANSKLLVFLTWVTVLADETLQWIVAKNISRNGRTFFLLLKSKNSLDNAATTESTSTVSRRWPTLRATVGWRVANPS